MSNNNPRPNNPGTWLVICDVCGRQRYMSECRYRWDGILCCLVSNCWDEKHAIFDPIPVINDPQPVVDVRPDQVSGTESYIDNISGLTTKFSGPFQCRGAVNGHVKFTQLHEKFGSIDSPKNYWDPNA
jgi:hypothetical protein